MKKEIKITTVIKVTKTTTIQYDSKEKVYSDGITSDDILVQNTVQDFISDIEYAPNAYNSVTLEACYVDGKEYNKLDENGSFKVKY